MSDKPGLLGEIHRRSVWQVVTVYGVGAWFALEVVQGIVDAGNLPEWLPGMALVLLIIGFPMVIATAVVQQGWSKQGEEPERGAGEPGTAQGQFQPSRGGFGDVSAETSSEAEADPGAASPNLATGTGSLDRVSTRPSAAHRLFTWKNAFMGGVLAFALWGVVATALLLTIGKDGPGPTGAMTGANDVLRAIAVLPFDNLSTDAENAYFADGIHEDVLTQLSKVADLTVISRTSVLAYRDTEMSLGEIANELGVGSVLEGSVRRSGDNVRITAQLIDARSDEHLWADNFDRALTTANIFAIQSEIAQRIAVALAATLSPAEEERIERSPTADLAAYDFYLQARTTYQLYSDGGNDEAIRLFKEALTRDADYADAWAGLADAYAQRVQRFGYGLEWGDSAEVAARRALQLEPDLPQGHKALALAFSTRGQVRASLDALLRAVELDPSYSAALNNIGVGQLTLGHFDEALFYTNRAYRLEPTTGFSSSNIAFHYVFLGMPGAAEERALEILRLQPSNESAVGVLRHVDFLRADGAAALARSRVVLGRDPTISRIQLWVANDALLVGDFETALQATEEALRLSPATEYVEFHHPQVVLGISLMRTGDEARGRQVLEEFRRVLLRRTETMPEENGIPFELAATDAVLGDVDSAVAWAERAYQAGYRFTVGLDVDPAYEALHDDPRWRSLLTRMAEDVAVMRANVQRAEAAAGRP